MARYIAKEKRSSLTTTFKPKLAVCLTSWSTETFYHLGVLFGLGDGGIDLVPYPDLINRIHAENHLAEIDILVGERLASGVGQTDKKLSIVALFFNATSGQTDGSSFKGNLIDFGFNNAATGAVALGISTLNHKSGFDSMESKIVVKTGINFV